MRKTILILLFILFIPCSSWAQKSISVAYPDFYPFFTKTDDNQVTGFFYEIVTQALENRMDMSTQWYQMPWKRCQEQVRSGKYDAIITVPTEARAGYTVTHQDYFYLKQLKLFTYTGHTGLARIETINSIEDIKKGGYTVITYSGNGWHEKNITGMGISSFVTSEVHNVWRMLAARRGDLVIEWPPAAIPGIEKSGVGGKVIETRVSLAAMPFHLLIGKHSEYTRILPRFNKVIKEMTKDGTIKQILSDYGIESSN